MIMIFKHRLDMNKIHKFNDIHDKIINSNIGTIALYQTQLKTSVNKNCDHLVICIAEFVMSKYNIFLISVAIKTKIAMKLSFKIQVAS